MRTGEIFGVEHGALWETYARSEQKKSHTITQEDVSSETDRKAVGTKDANMSERTSDMFSAYTARA